MISFFSSLLIPYESKIFEISAVILATAFVLFSSLILIPLQQCANYFSPSLLKYFKRDRVTIACMLIFLLTIFYNITMLFVSTLLVHAVIAILFLVFSFLSIVLMFNYIIKMLNPADYLLPKMKDNCIETFRHKLDKEEDITLQQQLDLLKEQIVQISLVTEQVDPNDKWAVNDAILDELHAKMTPLKSLAIKMIDASDYNLFEKIIQTICDISITYFQKREKYQTFHDRFLFSLYESLSDIAKRAEHSSNVYFSRALFSMIRDIALSTLNVHVLGYKNGYNRLTYVLWSILKESIHIAVPKGDKDRAYDAVVNLGDIGRELALKGTGHSASEIASELGKIANLCSFTGDTTTLIPVRKSIANIFFCLLWKRQLYANYSIPYTRMLEAYKIIIEIPVDPGTMLSMGDVIFSWDPDLSKDRSISTLVYAALFSPNNDDNVIKYNLDVIADIFEFIKTYHNRSYVISSSFTQHLYQIGLWLLAFIDEQITLEMILLKQSTTPTPENKKEAITILINILSYMLSSYFDCIEDKKENIKPHELLVVYLSLHCLSIYLDNNHNLDLLERSNSILIEFSDRINSFEGTFDYTARRSIETFCGYLGRIGEDDIGMKIWASADAKSEKYGSISPWHYFDHIRRPIMTFDENLFASFDVEIFKSTEGMGTGVES